MKKTFNRLLAATVAIPVALGQVLAISANAAEAPAALKVTADKLLKVEPATGFRKLLVQMQTLLLTL